MDDDFMDDAFIARMRQLQANPRPTPRKHTYTFHGVKVLCREGDDIPNRRVVKIARRRTRPVLPIYR